MNLRDVTFLGTSDSLLPHDEIINRLHIRMNNQQMEQDAYYKCLQKPEECSLSKYLVTNKEEIYNALVEYLFREVNSTDQLIAAQESQNLLTANFTSNNETAWFLEVQVYHKFYIEFKKNQLIEMEKSLVN